MKFDDLTADQKAAIKGEKGGNGAKGDALKFSVLTADQKAAIKGEKGDSGASKSLGAFLGTCVTSLAGAGSIASCSCGSATRFMWQIGVTGGGSCTGNRFWLKGGSVRERGNG